MTLIDLLFLVLFVVIIGWAAHYVISTFLPEPVRMVALLIVGVLLLLVILSQFSPVSGNLHMYRFYR